jgi:hypothetical protein
VYSFLQLFLTFFLFFTLLPYSGETSAMPDFARVYNFLGSIFDPDTNGHLQQLREMDPIDAETVFPFYTAFACS